MRISILALLLSIVVAAFAATLPYDEAADAKSQVSAAIRAAAEEHKPVLVVFGANWCGDCKVLDRAFHQGAAAPLISGRFKVVKVNVGKFDKNTELAESLGVPLKSGIPTVAVLSPQGTVLYVTKAGELADARNMGDKAIYDFFERVARRSAN
jgi:thioredoxin 1